MNEKIILQDIVDISELIDDTLESKLFITYIGIIIINIYVSLYNINLIYLHTNFSLSKIN